MMYNSFEYYSIKFQLKNPAAKCNLVNSALSISGWNADPQWVYNVLVFVLVAWLN